MLKHMLNGNASTAKVTASGELSRHTCSSLPQQDSRDSLSTAHRQQRHHQSTLQPQPARQHSPQLVSPLLQRQLQPPSDSVDGHLASCLRRAAVASEPEYQNTRRRSSPVSEFGHNVLSPAKSVRSMENVVAAGEPESRIRQPALDVAWMTASSRARPSLPSHDSGCTGGPAFAFVAAHQHQHQHQQLCAEKPGTPVHVSQQQLTHPAVHRDTTSNLSAQTSACPVFAPIANGPTKTVANGGLHIAKRSLIGSARLADAANREAAAASDSSTDTGRGGEKDADGGPYDGCGRESVFGAGIKGILTSLGLLCLISLLLALLSLIFLLKISPVTAAELKDSMRAEQLTVISPDEYVTVYEVTLALCSLTLSLNLCCLLVCSIQFLFAVKLARSSLNGDRTNNYLQKSAVTRVCAIAGFFISIPVFLTGVILYTFVQFHSTAAIVTSVLVGSGIVFCGCAMVHNVFVWQKEKTNAVKELVRQQRGTLGHDRPPRRRGRDEGGGGGRRREEKGDGPDDVCGADERSAVSARSPSFTLGQGTAVDGGSVSRASHELSTLV